jgi:hypothetical protein
VFEGDTHVTPAPRRHRRRRLPEDQHLTGFPELDPERTGRMSDAVTQLITERLDEFQGLARQTDEAIINGTTEPPASYAWQTRNFVEATYLAVLTQIKPDLAEATAAWVKDALEAADGTVLEVVYDWRQQLATGQPLWLPGSILEAL